MKIDSIKPVGPKNEMNTFYISFSDVMVLLCVFFLMLLAMSKIDTGSFERLRTGVTGNKDGTLVELSEQLQEIAKDLPQVSVEMDNDGVRLDLESAALFDTASANLKPGFLDTAWPILQKIKDTAYQIDIEGHTDDQPMYRKVGEELETNWSLSGRRASSVVHFLLEKGFSENRMRIVGYAANKPKTNLKKKRGENLKKARQDNRRVSILVH